jgi:urease gamma subunit
MQLTLHEREWLLICLAVKLADERKASGPQFDLAAATALITSFLLDNAHDGRSVAGPVHSTAAPVCKGR